MNIFTEALAYLVDLISLGIEFPTAHEHAVRLYELSEAESTHLAHLHHLRTQYPTLTEHECGRLAQGIRQGIVNL